VLLRQRALVTGPRHIAVDVLAVRFLRHADLQGTETRLGANLGSQDLIDRGAGGAAASVGRTGHDAAERAEMTVPLTIEPRRDVVDAAQHVHVFPHAADGRQAGGQLVVLARFAGNPVALGNPVAVPPDQEALVDARRRAGDLGRIRRPARIEHRDERRQTNLHRRAGHADSP
jgi:hypothetical protein